MRDGDGARAGRDALAEAGVWTASIQLDETLGKRYVAFKDPGLLFGERHGEITAHDDLLDPRDVINPIRRGSQT